MGGQIGLNGPAPAAFPSRGITGTAPGGVPASAPEPTAGIPVCPPQDPATGGAAFSRTGRAAAQMSVLAEPVQAVMPPNGRLLGFDLTGLAEQSLLRPGGRTAIYALGDQPSEFHPEREPLILAHGINGDPSDLQAIVDRFRDSPYQLYVVAYDDTFRHTEANGDDLADELRTLQASLGPGRDVTLVGHSMGGYISRQALNDLTIRPEGGIDHFGRVRLIAIDTPWQGYVGPADGLLMDVTRPFVPAGVEDVRAQSGLFQDSAPDRADGLLSVTLPANVQIELAFAETPNVTGNVDSGTLAQLPGLLVAHFRDGQALDGDARQMNYWRALQGSQGYPPFRDEMIRLAAAGQLDETAVRAALLRHFPRYAGNHNGILIEHPGQPSFLDHLSATLNPSRPATP